MVEPFGSTRDDHRAGVIAATIANMLGKKSATKLKPRDFFPEYQPKRQTWQDQLAIVEMLNAAFGGTDNRTKAA